MNLEKLSLSQLRATRDKLRTSYGQFGMCVDLVEQVLASELKASNASNNSGEMRDLEDSTEKMEELYRFLISSVEYRISKLIDNEEEL